MKKYINIPVRFKNPWFWVGIVGVIGNAMGLSFETLTSWERVWVSICCLFTNPFQLGCVFLAVLAVFCDPTTHGLGDSRRALGYHKPFKDPVV